MAEPVLPPGAKRMVLDLSDMGLPEVPMLGINVQTRAREGLRPHLHAGVMEICYLVRGENVFQVAGRDYRMRGGDIFWTLGEEEHGSGGHPFGRGLLYWLQVRLPSARRGFLALTARDSRTLVEALNRLPRRHFPGTRRLRPLFEEMVQLCRGPERPLRRLALAAALVGWLRLVVECAGQAGTAGHSADIRRALELVEERPGDDLRVADLAAAAGLSESRFKAKFRAEVGMPPREHVLRRKVERATRMLAAGEGVTRTAHALGFSSSQYFATVFKRYTHRRPSEVIGDA
jgi:AraC-like DNA-binding protein